MATAIAARRVYKHRGTGLTGHCRPACAESRPRRRQRPTGLEHCSNAVSDGLPAQTICLKFPPETSELCAKERDKPSGGGELTGVRKRRQTLSNRLRRRLGHRMGRICH